MTTFCDLEDLCVLHAYVVFMYKTYARLSACALTLLVFYTKITWDLPKRIANF